MKHTIFLFLGMIAASFSFSQKKTFYDFKVNDIDGNEVNLQKYKGKKILVVNVASDCGYTPQYKQLEWMYENYKDSNLVILAFPCNDFNGQEPGDSKKIKTFCQKNYGVTFPIMEKISVKGDNCHPLYKWLQHKDENSMQDNDVKWNFNKFMISETGQWQGYLPSKIKPDDKVVIDWIMNR